MYKHLIANELKTGDPIKFKATIESLGTEWRTHHLHLIEMEKTEDFINNDQKITLFHGATFNITGHLKHEGKLIPLDKNTVKELNEKTNKSEILKYLEENSISTNRTLVNILEDIKNDKINETEVKLI